MKKNWMVFLLLIGSFLNHKSYANPYQILEEREECNPTLDPRFYVSIQGGLSGGFEVECEEIVTNRGYYIGVCAGYKFWFPLRLEGEVLYQRAGIHAATTGAIQLKHTKGHIHAWSYMTNIILDINCDFPVRPYMGGGLGYAQASGSWSGTLTEMEGNLLALGPRLKRTFYKDGLAWQVIAGLKYFIYDTLEVNLEYRFFKIESKLSNHKLGLAFTQFF